MFREIKLLVSKDDISVKVYIYNNVIDIIILM